MDRYDEALSCYEKSAALQPDLAPTHARIGSALQELGRIEEAHRAFAQAVALDPRNTQLHLLLVECGRVAAGAPELAVLEEMGQDIEALGSEARMHLHFALAKALADTGDHDRSFQHFLEANKLKRAGLEYDEAAALRVFDEIRSVFSSEFIRTRTGSGDPSQVPVFIVGMPRSGSTLAEQILASHPSVFGGGERVDFSAILRTIGLDGSGTPFPHGVTGLGSADFASIARSYLYRVERAAMAAQKS